MTNQEFDNTAFFYGIKAKISGVFYPLARSDFEDRTIDIVCDDKVYEGIPCCLVERFSEVDE